MERSDDESSPCHHYHPASSADVIARGQRVTCSGDGQEVASGEQGPIRCCCDDQEAGLNLRDDVTQTDNKEVKCSSASVASCGCGTPGGDEPTCSAPPSQVDVNPVTPPSDSESDTQEGDVTSDLQEVSSDDDAFTMEPLSLSAAAPRYRNTFECGRRQSAPGQLGQEDGGPESELQSRIPGIAEYFSG